LVCILPAELACREERQENNGTTIATGTIIATYEET
jgi:hypothetical protein